MSHGLTGAASGTFDHPALGVVRYRMDEVSDDPDTQVAQVIGMMRGYVLEDAGSPELKRDAAALLHQYGDPVAGVFQWVRARMGFVNDENMAEPMQAAYSLPIVETLIRPRDMSVAGNQIGDCDDFSMYGAALLTALKVPCAFVTVAADPLAPSAYSHVYLAAYPTFGPRAQERVPLDISHGSTVGWEYHPELKLKRTEWPIERGCPVIGWALLAGAAYALYQVSRGAS